MATPNAEQLKAIEHQGGVLLKAGAGSGKTFVLKEHMIYLSRCWIQEFKQSGLGRNEFSQFAKNKLRKVVLMTFTKKAAGELAIRLHTEFKAMLRGDEENQFYWEQLCESLSYLNVSTIHGFCFRLIKMGFFPAVSADQTILTDSEYSDLIYEIFDRYLDEYASQKAEKEFVHLLLKDKQNVFKSIKAIFADPTLRLSWRDVKLEMDKDEFNQLIIDILREQQFDHLFETRVSFDHLDEFRGKKWFDYLSGFNQYASSIKLSYLGFIEFFRYFEKLDFKIPSKPTGKTVPSELVSYYESVRDFKDYLKNNGNHYVAYFEHFESYVIPWLKLIKGMIDFIEIEYNATEGVTFSDLEYLVYQNLQNPQTIELIQAEFQYFIVDEFQDTSYIQYSILEKLIGRDFSKLFCVGDLKQAIYGFRGGELGVFLSCEKSIPLNLSLTNNYRSDRSIIEFNNIFFDDLFKRGNKYQGVDKHAVEVEHQTIPDSKEDAGKVYELSCDLSFYHSEEKLTNLEVDYFEALALIEQIKRLQQQDGNTAVLYKRLKPSLILINLLMQENIGFVAQTKIPFLEDPILGLFYSFIEREFNQNEHASEYQQMLVQAYLNILAGKNIEINLASSISRFYKDEKYYGLVVAFQNFLEVCGVANSQFSQNLTYIETLVRSARNNKETLIAAFKDLRENSYSLDFYFGENPTKLRLMTAHASKGLQYKHILLGGIYTNENTNLSSPMIGKLPLSFKWSTTTVGKDKFKTPQYLLEEELTKQKEMSENKRLFYVANTRAESTLGWVELKFGELKRSKNQYNSWHSGIQTWFSETNGFPLFEAVDVNIAKNYNPRFLAKLENAPPFFHINSLGVEFIENTATKYILPELSVTRLATVAECPRKFYLQNICKFTEEELGLISNPSANVYYEQVEELTSKNILTSSAKRGTRIHENLSEIINNDLQLDELDLGSDKENIFWAVEKLKFYMDNFEFISEKPIKFELFGYMISGIPDLLIYSQQKSHANEIWDFKTGRFSESKLMPYYFQLYTYAYSQYVLGSTDINQLTKLVLCFIDEQKLVEKIVSFKDVENYLSEEIQKIKTPEITNSKACDFCSFQTICEK